MASRSKGHSRRDHDTDSSGSLKPLVVLVLLGTILYGAWSVVNNGPGTAAVGPAEPARADLASAPAFAPQVEIPAAPGAIPAAAPQANAAQAASNGAGSMPPFPGAAGLPPATTTPAMAAPPSAAATDAAPTYLNAFSAAPPVANSAAMAGLASPRAGDIVGPPGSAFAPPDALQAPSASSIGREAPPSAAFASAWADAHDKLAAGRYAEALAELSTWHDDPSLGLEESQRLEDLLGQLAGTVIYSQQDLLLPPHVVQPGETLLSVAAPLAVPWQLLAKINGVEDPARLVPGESLKLVRGPFDAVVSVSRRRLSLQVGGNYAGSFPVVVGRQIRERVGSAVPVVSVQQGDAPAEQAGPAIQVAWAQAGPRSIGLADGLSIAGVADPATVSDDTVPGTSLIVADRDLAELADILGQGSRVLVRQ
ncbi:MAG: LysM domain-containing protein [Planctomycetia bacterium]|nr:LysM domain-containing protein [Planctomycetia bacterium]